MTSRRRLVAVGVGCLLAGCTNGGTNGTGPADGTGGDDGTDPEDRTGRNDGTGTGTPMTDGGTSLSISSPAIEAGGEVPVRFTADGANVSPPLSIDGVPDETRSLAVVLDDPDAPGGEFVHWLLWNLPPETTSIPEDVPREPTVDSLGAVQGTNGFGSVGYRGPAPPSGDDPHRYRFTVSALDAELDVEPGVRRPALSDAMAGHVLASGEFTATYGR